MYLLRIMCLLLALTVLTPPTQAQTSDPDFQTAVEAWLQDNDAVALPLLSKLAKAGNEDAMILLGMLERQPGELSPFLAGLELKQRRALMRIPGGLSGRSWLTKVVDQAPFAKAIKGSRRVETRVDSVTYLLNKNEQSLSISPLRALIPIGEWEALLELFDHRNFPPQLWALMLNAAPYERPFSYPVKFIDQGMRALNQSTIQGYIFAYRVVDNMYIRGMDLQRNIGQVLFSGEAGAYHEEAFDRFGVKGVHPALREELYEAAAAILVKDEFVAPILELCKAKCPSDANQCTRAVYSMIGGYLGLLDVHTPIERYISNNRFLQSPRFAVQLSRQSTHLGVGWHMRKPISQCANKIIECRWKWCNR